MSHTFNSTPKEVIMSPAMMSFKEYYMSFMGIREPYLANGWGWFVDIESNAEHIRAINSPYKHRPSKYVLIPKTIKEYPSIRSMKSMSNLHDTSMIFEMDDDSKHRTNNSNYSNIIVHSIGIIGLTICYFLTCSCL
jgi:hypothetical protein